MATKKKTSKSSIQAEIEKKAIAIVDQERTNWEEAVSFITPRVAFRMRELIRILRKNYWGVFDQPIDPQTGRYKVWMGLIMSTVETWVKNIDLDQKDIGFIARNQSGYDITELTRLVVKDYLDRMYFGAILDTDERQVCIDGTVVWKTWEDNSTGKPVMKRKTVDLLNFYIDPTEDSIQSAYRVTERAILLPEQIAGMSGWMNTQNLEGSQVLNRTDGDRRSNIGTRMTGSYRDVWEMWGKIPRWMVTGDQKAEDANEEIDGHVIVSGLETMGPTMHLVEENKRKDKFGVILKPYEEWRPAKIAGRWYGLGPAERILALQEYLNITVNIRINRGYVSQLGLFKIKKGKGITAQMLNRLAVNGAIQVTDMDDIQQFNVAEAGETSYKDEEVIKYWAQAMASAYPISTGEVMPASTSATASSIASTSSKSGYTMFRDATADFLERWMDRGALPIIAKTINGGEIVRLSNQDDKFKSLIETIALNTVAEHLDKSSVVPSQMELMEAIQKEIDRISKKPSVFIEAIQDIVAEGLDTRVNITNEELDVSVTIQNLLQMMQLEQQDPAAMMETKKQIYDLMGLQMPKMAPAQPQPIPGGVQPNQALGPQSNVQAISQNANVPQAG